MLSLMHTGIFDKIKYYQYDNSICFWLSFGLANAINDYKRLRIRVVCVGNYEPLMLIIELVITNLSRIYFCIPEIFKRNVYNQFWVQNHPLNLCSRVVNSQRFLFSQKNWCEMFVFKLSGIQNVSISKKTHLV